MIIPSTPSVHLTLHVAARCLSEAERNELYEAAAALQKLEVGAGISNIKFMLIVHEFVNRVLWLPPFFMTGADGIDEKLIFFGHQELGRLATIRVPVYSKHKIS